MAMYIVTGMRGYDPVKTFMTDEQNLEKFKKEIPYIKREYELDRLYLNHAVMNISGYYSNGEYIGEL